MPCSRVHLIRNFNGFSLKIFACPDTTSNRSSPIGIIFTGLPEQKVSVNEMARQQ